MGNLVKLGVVCVLTLMAVSGYTNDKPSLDLDWYGYFKADGSYDQNLTSHGNFSMWVNPKTFEEDDTQFNLTANQTRLGLKVTSQGYEYAQVTGRIEFDLYGSVTGGTVAENKAMLQLRHAYFTVQRGGTMLLAGQSFDLISPLNPQTLNYSVQWGCGNVGYRRPQITLFQSFGNDNTQIILAAGAFRTIGDDLTPTFSLALGETTEGSDDGTDAAIPTVQGRLDIQHQFDSGMNLRLGASGLYGRLSAETNLGNAEEYESQGVFGHLQLTLPNGVSLSGEFYSGANLGSYFGGVLNNSTIEGVNSMGGWGALQAPLTSKVRINAGYSFDDPEDDDIGFAQRSKNQCIFGNIQYDLVPLVTLGLEVSSWETTYKDVETVSNLRIQSSFIFKI
jgi:hypothetical protein